MAKDNHISLAMVQIMHDEKEYDDYLDEIVYDVRRNDMIHGICACGFSKSCYNLPNTPENFCQCDSRDVVERSDFGFINDTVSLKC